MKIAILGAESTGKSTLALDLAARIRASGRTATVIPEVLREWCDRHGRTPRREEQKAIAQDQAHRVERAGHVDMLIADTTPLMTAIYSDWLFRDRSLHEFALRHQRGYDLTLVTALDLPWVADGLQRDGAHVREPIDRLVRGALTDAGIAYADVRGTGAQRTDSALCLINQARGARSRPTPAPPWTCEGCGDPRCARRPFTALLDSPAAEPVRS